MSRRKLKNRDIRKLGKSGSSLCVTLPIEYIRELGWREKQKVVVTKKGTKLTIEDWPKTSR